MSAQTKRKKRKPAVKRSRNSWVFPAIIAAIVVIGVAAVAITALGGDDSGTKAENVQAEFSAEVGVDGSDLPEFDASARSDDAVGLEAPELGSIDFQGRNVQVGGATGSPYALVFLAHWCPHCQAEVPRLVALAENGQIEGVEVVGVATATSSSQPNYPPSDWLAEEEWPFGVLLDDQAASAAQAYGLSGYPFMVFVDADGQVVGRTSGEISEEDLEAIFQALAAGDTLPIPGAGASSSR